MAGKGIQGNRTGVGLSARAAVVTGLVLAVVAGALGMAPAASGALVDGTLDSAFSNSYAGSATGFNNYVNSVVVQPDGKIVVGGGFTSL